MADDNTSKKVPIGQRIRGLINPALEDKRRQQIQLDLLSDMFQEITLKFPQLLETGFTGIFNTAVKMTEPEKNEFTIEVLTVLDPETGASVYAPKLIFNLAICTDFTSYQAEDIRDLPSYKLLHEAARAEDVAVKLEFLTADQARSGLPARLIIDASKSYQDGSLESGGLYPNLLPISEAGGIVIVDAFEEKPKPVPQFNRKQGRKIQF